GALHFARRGHGQRLDEFYLTRILVRRQTRAHVGLELARQRGRAGDAVTELDERLDHLAAHRIGRADGGGQRDRRVALQAVLDLARADAVAAARDHVVLAPDEPEVAVAVLARQVAGERPVADELVARRLLVVPVPEKHHRIGAAHRHPADLTVGHGTPGVTEPVDHL